MRFFFPIILPLTGCTQIFEPSEEWTDLNPPRQYLLWHHEVETCLKTQRSFDDIIWRVVHTETFRCADDLEHAAGCFVYPKTIYLVEAWLDLEWLVKAELIHYVRHDISHDGLFRQCGGR